MLAGGPADGATCTALIADTIASRFGFAVPVVLRTAEAVASLDAEHATGDRWAVLGREIHVRYATGSATSRASVDWFERELGVTATGRNLVTVGRLVEMAR